jgi:alkylhydroperoxidase/carboxymuconolactone decarboxylase family protein YurZ
MKVPSDAARRYKIVFRGECGAVFADLFSDLAIESRYGYTSVVAAVRDASEFYGLLDRFQDLALQPVSLHEIDGPPGGGRGTAAAGLGASSQALVRLAALAACDGKPASAVHEQVMAAVREGVPAGEIIDVLAVLLPVVGTARITALASAVQHAFDELAGPSADGAAEEPGVAVRDPALRMT